VSQPSANDLYKAAQALLRQGQPVFPCRATNKVVNGKEYRAKTPLIKGGLNSATLDREQVKAWWKRWGDAAIGIPTGIVYDVLDVDTKNESDGRVHLPRLQRLGLLNGCLRVARTPSGGWHLYFPAAPGLSNKASATLGLDVRGLGGYVLAPPSWIDDEEKSVGPYEDIGETTGSTGEPLHWDLIVSAIAPINTTTKKPIELLGYERQSSLASLRGWLSERAHGERNNALHWAVCRCIDNGIDPNELFEVGVLLGLGEDEVQLTIDSALKRAGLSADELYTEGEALFGRG
jgi:hypothetical protein